MKRYTIEDENRCDSKQLTTFVGKLPCSSHSVHATAYVESTTF